MYNVLRGGAWPALKMKEGAQYGVSVRESLIDSSITV
jgi:hypothetical protein